MLFKQIKRLVLSRQACRNFNDKPIKEEDLIAILDLSRLAPSACNSQPWEIFYTIQESKLIEIRNCLQDGNRNQFLNKAKAFAVISEKEANLNPGSETKFNNNHFVKYDIGEIVAYITLISKSKGIDSCIIGWVNKEKISKVIGTKNDINIVIAFGYSDESCRKKSRKAFNEIIKSI